MILIVIRKMTFFGDPCKKMRHDDVFHVWNGNYYIKDRWQILPKIKDFVASFYENDRISSEILKKSWHKLSRSVMFFFFFQRFCGMNWVQTWHVHINLIRSNKLWGALETKRKGDRTIETLRLKALIFYFN